MTSNAATSTAGLRRGYVIVAGFFFTVACQDQVISEATDIAKSSTMALNIPKEVQDKFDQLQKEKPNTKFIIIEVDEAGQAKLESMTPVLEELMHNGDKSLASLNIITPTAKPSEPIRTFMIAEYKEGMQQVSENSKKEGDIYTVVEDPASPVGGLQSIATLIMNNMHYPSDARMKGTEGTLFIEFGVN